MAERRFTLEEAEALLSKIQPLVESMVENRRQILQLGNDLMTFQEQVRVNEGKGVEPSMLVNKQTEMEFLASIIQENLDAIEELGAQPKDIDMGLIDFPSVLDGEQVLLCWKLGETSINFYHDNGSGFSGRKPLNKKKKS